MSIVQAASQTTQARSAAGRLTPERLAALTRDLAARAAEHDRDGSFPFENFDRLHAAGLLSLTVPRAFGGDGQGLAAAARVVQAVAQGEASTALILAMHYIHHGVEAHARAWPEAVYRRVATASVAGIALINSLRVEPDLGSPARGGLPATVAQRRPDGWRLTGHKLYSTGCPILRWYLVWARTDDAEPLTGAFLVPRDAPGIRIVETWDHLGMRATASHDVLFDQVALPADHALELRPPAGWRPDDIQAGWSNGLLSALYHGVAVAARDWLVGYLQQRAPGSLGAPLATLPRIQEAVGEIEGLLYANDQLIAGLAAAVDGGATPGAVPAGLTKRRVTANAIDAVQRAVALIGNPALSRRNPLERHLRDVLCSRIHTPQDDSIAINAGRAALSVA